jgi:transposase
VKDLRAEAVALKELVADLTLENRLLKKTYGPPRLQELYFRWRLTGLHQRIRRIGMVAVAKMEIRASRAS